MNSNNNNNSNKGYDPNKNSSFKQTNSQQHNNAGKNASHHNGGRGGKSMNSYSHHQQQQITTSITAPNIYTDLITIIPNNNGPIPVPESANSNIHQPTNNRMNHQHNYNNQNYVKRNQYNHPRNYQPKSIHSQSVQPINTDLVKKTPPLISGGEYVRPVQSPYSSLHLKRNSLAFTLQKLLGIVIDPLDLCVHIVNNYNNILQIASKNTNTIEKQQSHKFLQGYINSEQLFDKNFVETNIMNNLFVLFDIKAYPYFDNNQLSSSLPNTKNYNYTQFKQPTQAKNDQIKLIKTAPKISSGDAYFPLEYQSVDILTRIFYDLIKTSKKFFAKNNIKVEYEKGGFSNLDFTSLRLTLDSNKSLAPARKSFMSLKAIRNNWAHFSNTVEIPSYTVYTCLRICKEIYEHYKDITLPNSEARTYMERKIFHLDLLERDFKVFETKPKIVSGIIAQFCKDPKKKNQSSLKVLELLSEKLKQNNSEEVKELDKLSNEILLNLLPRSPYLMREMKKLYEKEISKEDLMLIYLEHEYQSRLKKVEHIIKGLNPSTLNDERFVSTTVFFRSVVLHLEVVGDNRKNAYEMAYKSFLLEKCIKTIQENIQIDQKVIQKFIQEKGITIDKTDCDIIIQEVYSQANYFRQLWIAIANGFSSSCECELPNAIKYFSWALSEMAFTQKFFYPTIIQPYIELTIMYITKCINIMVGNIAQSDLLDVESVKNLVQVCLAACLKFYYLSTDLQQLAQIAKQFIALNLSGFQFDNADLAILNTTPENSSQTLLIPITLQFSDLKKSDRINITIEGSTSFNNASDILNLEI